ncbi:MAG: ATP-binding cassette domain-containing protein [Candidatus Lokiarchaeota archaeon]|nr:ATP-binding cassette domain-containing protein [Candidatus Lokiarchaeota archaeon]
MKEEEKHEINKNGIDSKKQPTEIKPPSPSGHRRMFHTFGQEKEKLKHSRNKLNGWIFSYILNNKYSFIFYLILIVASTAIISINPLLAANIIDFGIVARNYDFLFTFSIIYCFLLVIYIIASFIGQYGLGKVSQNVVFSIRNDIFSQLQKMSMDYFDKRISGDIISVTTNDVDQLNTLISGQVAIIINSIVTIILTIVFMYILNPILATLSLLIIPIFLLMTYLFRKTVIGAFKKTRKTISSVTSSIQENISGVKVVQAYGQEKKAEKEFDKANKANYDASFKVRKIFSTFFPLVQLITNVMTVIILLIGGFMAIGSVSIFGFVVSVGVLTAFITYLSQFFRPFMMLGQLQQILEGSYAASDRILSLLEEEVEIPDIENPKSIDQVDAGEIYFQNVNFGYRFDGNKDSESKKHRMLKRLRKKRTIENPEMIVRMADSLEKLLRNQMSYKDSSSVSSTDTGSGGMGGSSGPAKGSPKMIARTLAMMDIPDVIFKQFSNSVKKVIKEQMKLIEYETSKGYVLKDIDLKVEAGETLAIVGETGAGKTTMIKLLSRFYDVNEGKITIDGIDIKNLKKDDLRRIFGLVSQNTYLFTGTIKENLLYAFNNPPEEIEKKMISVSKFLGLHNFVETLPEKYETVLIENGSNISIGQRQLIAFARALITDPTILILDEATSSVDPYTESLIQDALDKARKGRTTIIIAHRLSTIKNADQIIVLDKETHKIIEKGSHSELLEKDGKYKRLLQMQHKDIIIE